MTVRLAQYIGMDKVVDFASRFGLDENLQPTLASSLGAGEVTLIQLATAYGMFVNGGKAITPTLIDRVQDRRGKTVFRHDERPCIGCNRPQNTPSSPTTDGGDEDADQAQAGLQAQAEVFQLPPEPLIPDDREQVLDPRIAYQMVSMLEGVVQRGTGRRIGSLGIPLAGKTGTTNDENDAWFMGFSPDLVVGVFVGFDLPRSLGNGEEGSSAAAPIFRQFMSDALKDSPHIPFRIPSGIRLVRVNATTGMPATNEDGNVIFEAFIPGTEPTGEMMGLDGASGFRDSDDTLQTGTGGIY